MAGSADFTMTEADYLDANRDWYRLYLLSRRGLWSLLTMAGVCAAIGATAFLADGKAAPDILYGTFGFALLGGTMMLVMHAIAYLSLPLARRLYRQQKEASLPQHWNWDERGLRIETRMSVTNYEWEDFHHCALGRGAFLLFVNQQLFHVLPLHYLRPDQRQDLTALIAGRGKRLSLSRGRGPFRRPR